MADPTTHPTDEVLFDLIDGTLDDARVAEVGDHLKRCPSCALFVRSATVGGDAYRGLVEEMPDEHVATFKRVVGREWRLRREAIARIERHADEAAPSPVPEPTPRNAAARPAPRRVRRLVPILAFVVLGTLAGITVSIGNDSSEQGADSGANEQLAPEAGGTVAGDSGGAVSAPPTVDGSVAPVDGAAPGAAAGAEAASGADTDQFDDAARDAQAGSASGLDPSATPTYGGPRCIVTFDQTNLTLPDGRLAQKIVPGPLGMFLVCG